MFGLLNFNSCWCLLKCIFCVLILFRFFLKKNFICQMQTVHLMDKQEDGNDQAVQTQYFSENEN